MAKTATKAVAKTATRERDPNIPSPVEERILLALAKGDKDRKQLEAIGGCSKILGTFGRESKQSDATMEDKGWIKAYKQEGDRTIQYSITPTGRKVASKVKK
jgi:hypothetical protein